MKGSIFEVKKRKTAIILFIVTLTAGIVCLAISVIHTTTYNKERFQETFAGAELFSAAGAENRDVSVTASARSSTWG